MCEPFSRISVAMTGKVNIFGRDVRVYLDTFHFKQRLRRALPKHPQKLFVSGQLKKFLTGDRHWTREEILEALDVWHNLAIQEGLGTRTLAQAVENAKGHVRKGCLDENKVGTQPCETLHKDLNRIMQAAWHGVEYAHAKLALFLHHRNWRIMQRKLGEPDFFLWPHECENPDHMDTTNEIFGVPADHCDEPVDFDEEILVEVWDAICQADACVRDDMNDLFLKHPNMRVLDGFGKDAWTVKRIRVPGDGFCLYRALQVALHRDGTIDELTWEDVRVAVLREYCMSDFTTWG